MLAQPKLIRTTEPPTTQRPDEPIADSRDVDATNLLRAEPEKRCKLSRRDQCEPSVEGGACYDR